jgi:5-formyltetrahydrofolate cyclo-ligase
VPLSSVIPAWVDAEAVDDAKESLRVVVAARRSKRGDQKREEAALAIADHLLSLPEVDGAACVSIYASMPDEPGTLPAIEALASRGATVLLPMLGEGLTRCWGEYTGMADLVERAPGRPPEPSGDTLPQEAIADADVIVAPAMAVDGTGTRLGQGGGWYDRVLKYARPNALIVAVAFPDEVILEGGALPRASHDIRVHAVVTPEGVTRFTR